MAKEIKLLPEMLGFVTAAEAQKMGATPEALAGLDYLKMHGRTHYRRVDVEQLITTK